MNKIKLSLFLLIALALVFSGCTGYQIKPVAELGPTPSTYDGDISVSQQGNIIAIKNTGDEAKRVYVMFYDNQSVLRCNLDYKAMPAGAKFALFLPEDFMTLVWEFPS